MKKYWSMVIAVTILLLNTNISFGEVKINSDNNSPLFESMLEVLELEKESRMGISNNTQYSVYDFNGRDITDTFKNVAYAMYVSNEKDYLKEYCVENIKKISITTETQVATTRSDLSKTVDHHVVELLKDTNGKKLSCTADYTVRGSITYDPNTYQISSASTPIIVKKILTPSANFYTVKTKNEVASSKIAANRLSANFSYEYDIYMTSNYDNVDFGTTSCSFTITPN